VDQLGRAGRSRSTTTSARTRASRNSTRMPRLLLVLLSAAAPAAALQETRPPIKLAVQPVLRAHEPLLLASLPGTSQAGPDLSSAAHLIGSLGFFLVAEKYLKKAVAAAGISFPASLIGMFAIFATLSALSSMGMQRAADALVAAVKPALDWLSRWLPLFYVPSLVVLPLACKAVAAADLAKVGALVALGMPLSLFVTAQLVVAIRAAAKTEMLPLAPASPMAPFRQNDALACAVAAVLGLAGAAVLPAGSPSANLCAALWGLGTTAGGLLLGSLAPPSLKKRLPHPVVTTAVCANLGCLVIGLATGVGYMGSLGEYLNKGKLGSPGAGDLLMGFLGPVVLSFGFRIYGQRALLKRHAAEVLGCAAGSALASILATAAAGRALGLPPPLTLAVAPRSVTVALAMPIAAQLGAPPELIPVTAAAVVLTGLLGAALAQKLLDKGGYKGDPITRGLATAGSAHGLGTAALAASEPEALPFCALAYGLIGIAASSWAAVPAVQVVVAKLAGATG